MTKLNKNQYFVRRIHQYLKRHPGADTRQIERIFHRRTSKARRPKFIPTPCHLKNLLARYFTATGTVRLPAINMLGGSTTVQTWENKG